MKRVFKSAVRILIVLGLLPCALHSQSYQSSPTTRRDSLRQQAIPIRSIDAVDENFSDLEPLIEKIGSARVVVLGEATHDEGTTSRAKARLVRFLHQRMGFDVLAWESGLLQCYAMNAALRETSLSLGQAKAFLMSGGWASEEDTQPVFEYARSTWRTTQPLEMAGFDSGRPRMGGPYFRQFVTALSKRAPSLTLTEVEWLQVTELTKRGYGFISNDKPNEEARTQQRDILEHLLQKLRRQRADLLKTMSEKELAIAERFIADALMSEAIDYIRRTKGLREWNVARDSYMSDTFQWLQRTLYPDRKIIVWAATSHLIRNSTVIVNTKKKDMYASKWEMGNHLYPQLGNDLYTIAFTAYAGKEGDIFPEGYGVESQVSDMTPPSADSFEAVAHQLAQPYLFVDLRQASKTDWLGGTFGSVALGRVENLAPWAKVIDAFFFIDQAEPKRYLPRSK